MKISKTFLNCFNFKNILMVIILLFMFIYLYNHLILVEGNKLEEKNDKDEATNKSINQYDDMNNILK